MLSAPTSPPRPPRTRRAARLGRIMPPAGCCGGIGGPHATPSKKRVRPRRATQFPNTQLKISGATIVASLSTMNFGVEPASLPHVIFSFGTAPE